MRYQNYVSYYIVVSFYCMNFFVACEHNVTEGFAHKIVPIVVIGGGVAGLSAAEYGARSHVPIMLLTGEKRGGQIIDALEVENVPGLAVQSGAEIVDRLEEQALTFGAQIIEDTVIEIVPTELLLFERATKAFLIKTHDGRTFYALAVIIATGSSPRTLNVPGEQDYWGNGVHTCPRCDALFYKGCDVAVVGGGDTAIEYAELLASYARHVTMLVRAPAMRATARLKSRLAGYENISILYYQRIIEIKGNGKKVIGVVMEDSKTGDQSFLPLSALFLAIGHEPTISLVRSLVTLMPSDHIYLAKRTQETSMPGIFSAGDVDDPMYRQAVVAEAEGAKAALDAVSYLHEQGITENMIRRLYSSNRLEIFIE